MSWRHGAVECVINISEGRNPEIVAAIVSSAGRQALDVHTDPDHHRSVLTLGGSLPDVEAAARSVARATVSAVDLRVHAGVHPRLGALDVVPFVPLPEPETTGRPSHPEVIASVLGARDRFARWAGDALALPCFLYGPERSLPEIRRTAFVSLAADTGPPCPHPTAGATAVGVRPILVAYNLWLVDRSEGDHEPDRCVRVARTIATGLRGPGIRALGLPFGSGAQVSMNLIDTDAVSMTDLYDSVTIDVEAQGCAVQRAEVVGLVPEAMLATVPRHRWAELDLHEDRTIEARLEAAFA